MGQLLFRSARQRSSPSGHTSASCGPPTRRGSRAMQASPTASHMTTLTRRPAPFPNVSLQIRPRTLTSLLMPLPSRQCGPGSPMLTIRRSLSHTRPGLGHATAGSHLTYSRCPRQRRAPTHSHALWARMASAPGRQSRRLRPAPCPTTPRTALWCERRMPMGCGALVPSPMASKCAHLAQ